MTVIKTMRYKARKVLFWRFNVTKIHLPVAGQSNASGTPPSVIGESQITQSQHGRKKAREGGRERQHTKDCDRTLSRRHVVHLRGSRAGARMQEEGLVSRLSPTYQRSCRRTHRPLSHEAEQKTRFSARRNVVVLYTVVSGQGPSRIGPGRAKRPLRRPRIKRKSEGIRRGRRTVYANSNEKYSPRRDGCERIRMLCGDHG